MGQVRQLLLVRGFVSVSYFPYFPFFIPLFRVSVKNPSRKFFGRDVPFCIKAYAACSQEQDNASIEAIAFSSVKYFLS